MWDCLSRSLCGREEPAHVWNLQHCRHFTARPKPRRGARGAPAHHQPLSLDWSSRRRIDSYHDRHHQSEEHVVLRNEFYHKIRVQHKTPFYTEELFSVNMRNVNERITSERCTRSDHDRIDPESSLESEGNLVAKRGVFVDVEPKRAEEEFPEKALESGGSSSVGSGLLLDLETVVTEVEDDSLERTPCEGASNICDHDSHDIQEQRSRFNLRYGRINVGRWMRASASMPAAALERSCNGALALHYAAARGCLDCVRLLVDASTDLTANTQMDNDVTPVYLAAQEGHLEVLKFLVLEAGGSLYVRAKDGMAPVHAASQMGCLNCLKWMVQDQGVDPNLRDGDGATPLHFAASRGHVEVVRWLLRHGAKLVIDKFGKSPINDAAENHQMECLNLLVQRGTTPDYHDHEDLRQGKLHGCTCRPSDHTACSYADCINYGNSKEPFYLHPPTLKDGGPPPVKDGLYVNPMTLNNGHSHAHGFYLHNPQEVPYHRVKDLFVPEKPTLACYSKPPPPPPPPPPLTVKVEVHSSSSGAGSDENMSSSDLSERGSGSGAGGDHDYEDIYLVRSEAKPRRGSRDSGSHSITSVHSNVVIDSDPQQPAPELPPANDVIVTPHHQESPEIKNNNEDQPHKTKTKLNHSHSMPYPAPNNRALKRVVSEPGGALPPPPPPPPPEDLSLSSENSDTPKPSTATSSSSSEPDSSTLPVSTASSKPDSPHNEPATESGGSVAVGPNLVNKQMVLPFIPPKFPSTGADADDHSLIKPSEYLKALGAKSAAPRPAATEPPVAVHTFQPEVGVSVVKTGAAESAGGPPPPPLPEPLTVPPAPRRDQPLGAISIQDLNSVQLRRTKALTKTMSAPLASLTATVEPFQEVKQDLIEELKKSKDITGIKKMKIEKVKMEEQHEKQLVKEIANTLTVDSFVEKIPEKDTTGNPIPPWKRQMLAKKAADKARKEMEEVLAKQAEEKRLQAIPAWKRQLMQAKKPDEKPPTLTLKVPAVEEKKTLPAVQIIENNHTKENKENSKPIVVPVGVHKEMNGEDQSGQIIPWRAQLKKTNSTLNLLE